MSDNESTEMYLETIYILEKSCGHAHGVDIAKRLGVSKPSVTKAMKNLKDKKLVNKESYGIITLTEKGKELSKKIYKKHKLISLYLAHSLKLTDEEVDFNACKMEHIISGNMLEAIKMYLEKNDIEYEK